jgi:type II secretory pathway component PulJ
VEVLAALAISSLIATTVGGFLFALQAGGHAFRRETDTYESLRLAADLIMQDARFAVYADDGDYLQFCDTMYCTSDTYVLYKFAVADDPPDRDGGTPDPRHLHRWVVDEGVLVRDDIVGWDLVPPDGSGDSTEFEAVSSSLQRWALARLVKAPAPGQEKLIRLEVRALLR